MLKAVFLDKDGTLIENVPFNTDPRQTRLLPGADQGLRLMQNQGYCLVIVTNQPGLARGYFREIDLRRQELTIRRRLEKQGVMLSGFYFCPHDEAAACSCRKPGPGLLLKASRELGLDLKRSWLVGDILHDVEAGRRAGCRTILIDNGSETEWQLSPGRLPHHIAADLEEAGRIIAGLCLNGKKLCAKNN